MSGELVLRETAENHAAAVVAGNFEAVLSDLDPSLHSQMAAMASLMPEGLSRSEIVRLAVSDGRGLTETRYVAPTASLTIRATWEWRAGRFIVTDAEPQH